MVSFDVVAAAAVLLASMTLAGCTKQETYSIQGELGDGASLRSFNALLRDLGPHGATSAKVSKDLGDGTYSYTVGFPTRPECEAAIPVALNLTYVRSAQGCFYGFRYGT